MARKGASETLRDRSWAERYPNALRQDQQFCHGEGIDPEALSVLRSKGYLTVDFRTLEGEEKLEAMFSAVTNGVYDPSSGELKVLDLHMKHLKEKDKAEDTGNQAEVVHFLDLLQDFASREKPEWAKSAKTDTPAPPQLAPEAPIADILAQVLAK